MVRVTDIDEDFSSKLIDLEIDDLFKHVSAFRAAIIKANPVTFLLIGLHNFPLGACGDTASLLAKYLAENGYGDFDYVAGERKGRSHAWLERAGLIVDITGDQFEDQEAAVIVTKDHGWHSSFNGSIEKDRDIEKLDSYNKALFLHAYEQIKKHI